MERLELHPRYYKRDGTPITSPDPAIPEVLVWAMEFEVSDRQVASTMTPYGERLSTVFLGLDHSFMPDGPPILFESMLFAPQSQELKQAKRQRMRDIWRDMTLEDRESAIEKMVEFPEEAYIEKHYPHDGLQLRYETEAQALKAHNRLKLQCLIPPRWRRFLLYKIGRDGTWS